MKLSKISDLTGFRTSDLMVKYGVQGFAVSVIDKEDVFLDGYGYADKRLNKTVNKETIFQCGSISKIITTWGIMKLVQSNVLQLDVPIMCYLSKWSLPSPAEYHKSVTIRKLLSFTSGLSVMSYMGSCKHTYNIEDSISGKYNKRYKVRFIHEPGGFYYSGGGFSVLQLIIEETTEMSFSNFMKENIFKPLGMTNSTFDFDDHPPGMFYTKAYGAFGRELPLYKFSEKAAAGLYSSLEDMTKFAVFHNKPNPILDEEHYNMMFKRVRRENHYGLGYISKLVSGTRVIITRGINRGWVCSINIIPEYEKGIVLLANNLNGINLMNDILHGWYKNIFNRDIDLTNIFPHKRNRLAIYFSDLNMRYKCVGLPGLTRRY